jgi:hypothetical protein
MDEQEQASTAKQEGRKVTYVAVFTLVVVSIYGAGSLWSLLHEGMTFKEFSATFGPLAGLMLGYWVRGSGSTG